MDRLAESRTRAQPTYSFSVERVALDPAFPVFMFPFSLSHDPITNLHCHDVLEIGLCVKGNGIFIIDNTLQPYEAGDIVVISPGLYHRAKSGAGMDDLWYFIYFNPEDWNIPHATRLSGKLIRNLDDPDLAPLVRLLVGEMNHELADRSTIVEGLIKAIVVRLSRLESAVPRHPINRYESPRVIDDRINKALDFMISSENHGYTISELAGRCNLSEAQFRHLFKEQVGMSPKHFKTKLQINTAMNMLKLRREKVITISEKCGFESLSSFNRLFSKETGLSPSQWRSKQGID
jgi:AraC-like DNA-binding protein/quercetin dioxygenase-like cupin family protein